MMTVLSSDRPIVDKISRILFKELYFWWPIDLEYHRRTNGDWRIEVIVGAILTQNTKWDNVEKALENMKKKGIQFSIENILNINEKDLARLIKPVSFYNVKSKRLIELFKNIKQEFGDIDSMSKENTNTLREFLLNQKGVGKETADVILLYALEKPIFVIDSYTKRFVKGDLSLDDIKLEYDNLRVFFEDLVRNNLGLFIELIITKINERCEVYFRKYYNCISDCSNIPINPCDLLKDGISYDDKLVIVFKELHAQIDMYMKNKKNKRK